MNISEVHSYSEKMTKEIKKVIVGKEELIALIVTALFANGHVLLEDDPGTGKTMLAKTLAKSIGGSFKRVQMTPDLMPSDIVGLNVYSPKDAEFHLKKGPVFTDILLADEINRTTPRTQSALLEAMEERQVTIDGATMDLDDSFFVIATENPIETTGTYPLPEAQLDRFLFKLLVEFPKKEELKEIMDLTVTNQETELSGILTGEDITAIRSTIREMPISDAVMDYALSIVVATHPESDGAMEISKKYIANGASPRAAQAIVKTAKARAFLEGRFNVSFEDVAFVACPALRHRLVLNFEAVSDGVRADDVIRQIIDGMKTV